MRGYNTDTRYEIRVMTHRSKKASHIRKDEYVVTPEYTTTSFRAAETRKKSVSIPPSEYRRHIRALTALEKTSQLLAIETHINGILKNIATTIGKALGARYVNFWNFTPDKRKVFIVTTYGMQRQYVLHSRKNPLPVGKAWIGRAMKTGQAWATSNVQKDPFLPTSWLPAVRKQKYHGLLCAPLIRKKNVIGGMCIYYKKKHVFEYAEMGLATIVANQAATAVENARIFNDLLSERTKTVSIIQSLEDGLIMYDLHGRIVFFNPKAEEYLLVSRRTIIGKKLGDLAGHPNGPLSNLRTILELTQRDYETREYTIENPQRIVFLVTKIPVRSQTKESIGTMIVLHDITREKDVELLKIRFISTASHQLRTPLTGIKWSLDYMLKGSMGALTEAQTDMVKKTFHASSHMVSLVNDLLDTSRIEEGKYGYIFRMGDIPALIRSAISDVELRVQEKNITMNVRETGRQIPQASFDEKKLKIALMNILDNAIKYSHAGGAIEVTLRPEPEYLFITIEDHGIGISKEDTRFIFNKFFRAKNAVRFQSEGSGLGLFIAKSIIETHNGSIAFESEENKGTKFIIQLPLAAERMPKGTISGL